MTDLATIEAFLYREASFLDRPDLDSWIELYTDDAYYWIPATEDQVDPINHVSHIQINTLLLVVLSHSDLSINHECNAFFPKHLHI